eukprot:11475919-Alexandrium_andersonii.AAC.1
MVGVLAPDSGKEHGLGARLDRADMPGHDCGKLPRPPLNGGTQARKGSLTVRRQTELGDDRQRG